MGAMQRTKGATAERVVAGLIRDWLGLPVFRNWQGQAAEGGADLSGIPGWSIEIKRAKEFRHDWWDQAEEQAADGGATPVLIYLIDRTRRGQPLIDRWRAILPVQSFSRFDVDAGQTAEISLRAWIQIAREGLPSPHPTPEGCGHLHKGPHPPAKAQAHPPAKAQSASQRSPQSPSPLAGEGRGEGVKPARQRLASLPPGGGGAGGEGVKPS